MIVLTAITNGRVLPATPGSHEEPLSQSLTAVSRSDLEGFRQSGDLRSQRRHVWDVVAQLTNTVNHDGRPLFESWYGEDAVFAKFPGPQAPRGVRGFSRVHLDQGSVASNSLSATPSADVPVLTYTLYNYAAYHHIRQHRLYLQSELKRLRDSGPGDNSVAGDRSIAPFPTQAMVLKTAWWPVAKSGLTALPVWDPERNPQRRGGNDYTTWQRVVAVGPSTGPQTARTVHIDFAGQAFRNARRTDLRELYYVVVGSDMAKRLTRDPSAEKLALLALGRDIEAGDYLVLVGANLATKEIPDWMWATVWWHDQGAAGPFAADRPAALHSPWRNYLLQVAFDSDKPADRDGGPHICFNPWLEGRFADGGHGGGTVSNCLACHRRASYPPVSFLPVTRGSADLTGDSAYAPGQLRTNFNWSLALHARP
jgi:hypothetical protein